MVADKLSRLGQTIQTEWSLLQEAFQAICNRWHQPQVDLFATRFNNKLAQFVSPVPDPQALGSQCTQPAMGGSGPICLPTSSHFEQSGEAAGLPMQEYHSDSYGVAQHALVLGSSGHVLLNPTGPAQPVHSAIQSDSPQESAKPKSACMAPRTSTIKEQGFPEAVSTQIEAPESGSTRSVYEAKWAIFTK